MDDMTFRSSDPQGKAPTAGRRPPLVAVILVAGLCCSPALADESAIERDAREAGRAAGSALHEIGRGAKNAGLQAGNIAADAGRNIGHGAADVGRNIGRGAVDMGRAIGRTVKECGREFGQAIQGVE